MTILEMGRDLQGIVACRAAANAVSALLTLPSLSILQGHGQAPARPPLHAAAQDGGMPFPCLQTDDGAAFPKEDKVHSFCLSCCSHPAATPSSRKAARRQAQHAASIMAPPSKLFLLLQDNDGGVSRDEMASTLLEVTEGRIPKDRIALREVWREISSWPFLDADTAKIQEEAGSEANYAGITKTG